MRAALKAAVALAVCLTLGAGMAHAQSSLGIGSAEAPAPGSETFFPALFNWIAMQQREFYRAMTEALRAMRADGSAGWLLVGLSFAYGVFHAAGPGHGKVVISSYMLANETALRRGVMLALASSLVQALSAIVIVGTVFAFLRGTAVSMTDARVWVEGASYAFVAVFGLWLLVRKLAVLRRGAMVQQAVPAHAGHTGHDHSHHHHDHHLHHGGDGLGDGGACSQCGHVHMPTPDQVRDVSNWKEMAAAVFSVGLRPCSGAVIVLSFALVNGMVAAGVLSVFAMAAGTAVTVSALATLSVLAKGAALRLSGSGVMSARLHAGIEIAAASLILIMGLILLGGLMVR